jgi:hypothetical protein
LSRKYEYYDPIYLLPASGQAWWRDQTPDSAPVEARTGT